MLPACSCAAWRTGSVAGRRRGSKQANGPRRQSPGQAERRPGLSRPIGALTSVRFAERGSKQGQRPAPAKPGASGASPRVVAPSKWNQALKGRLRPMGHGWPETAPVGARFRSLDDENPGRRFAPPRAVLARPCGALASVRFATAPFFPAEPGRTIVGGGAEDPQRCHTAKIPLCELMKPPASTFFVVILIEKLRLGLR